MARERQVDALMKKLLQSIEASLAAADAARDAVQEILRRGADTGIFFAGSQKGVAVSSELTDQDKEFLRAVSIKPDR
jgi:hypothetical protein